MTSGRAAGFSGFVGVVLAFYLAAAAVTEKTKVDNATKQAVALGERETAALNLRATQEATHSRR